jgi:hypothetical protein
MIYLRCNERKAPFHSLLLRKPIYRSPVSGKYEMKEVIKTSYLLSHKIVIQITLKNFKKEKQSRYTPWRRLGGEKL